MSFLDRLFGHAEEPKREEPQRPAAMPASEDELALARYRYMLKTAPPETIEQAHEEAFAKLTPEQRRMVLQQLASEAPEHEKASIASASDDPRSVARVATRAELQRPGVMERVFGGVGGGVGRGIGGGGMGFGGTLLTSLAAGFAGSMIAQHFFNHTAMGQGFYDSYGGFPGGGGTHEEYEHGGRAGDDVGAGVADTDDQETQTVDSGEDSPDESEPDDTDEDTPDDDDSGSDDSGSFDDGGGSDS